MVPADLLMQAVVGSMPTNATFGGRARGIERVEELTGLVLTGQECRRRVGGPTTTAAGRAATARQ